MVKLKFQLIVCINITEKFTDLKPSHAYCYDNWFFVSIQLCRQVDFNTLFAEHIDYILSVLFSTIVTVHDKSTVKTIYKILSFRYSLRAHKRKAVQRMNENLTIFERNAFSIDIPQVHFPHHRELNLANYQLVMWVCHPEERSLFQKHQLKPLPCFSLTPQVCLQFLRSRY
jgi:hypothetical protein